MKKNQKVLLGMSGGTDSSVAAMLLQEAGYEVTGVTFRFYEKSGDTEYLDDARDLCRQLHIPHIVYDAREPFREHIISYFIREYLAGRTPVPCTLCNNHFKWPLLRRLADEQDIRHLATGHYVQTVFHEGHWYVTSGADSDKDQSFFLWGLPQDILERMLLPLGALTKPEVRRLAAERGFHKAARKRDSLGVCFCPMDYRGFLHSEVPPGTIMPGDFYDEQGQWLGRHEGYPHYTIGQRRGLGICLNKPLFVKQIFPDTNRIILSSDWHALEKHTMILADWSLVCPEEVFHADEPLIVKIRYRKQANHCTVRPAADGRLHVSLHEPLAAIACGQAAAFYIGGRVVGGGIIDEAL